MVSATEKTITSGPPYDSLIFAGVFMTINNAEIKNTETINKIFFITLQIDFKNFFIKLLK